MSFVGKQLAAFFDRIPRLDQTTPYLLRRVSSCMPASRRPAKRRMISDRIGFAAMLLMRCFLNNPIMSPFGKDAKYL